MASWFTGTRLVEQVRRRGVLPPASPDTFTDEDILRIADDEMMTSVVPILLSVRQEYLTAELDVTMPANQANYTLSARAIGGGIRSMRITDGQGGYVPLKQIDPDLEHDYTSSSDVQGYKYLGNGIRLVPAPASDTPVRVTYHQRPGRLVTEASAAKVTGIAGSVVTAAAGVPSAWATTDVFDFVRGDPGFETLAIDKAITGKTATTITFTAAPPTGLAVGDWVTLEGESPIPQIPADFHPFLVERTLWAVLAAKGDPKAAFYERRSEAMKNSLISLITPRDKSSAIYVHNKHAPGWPKKARW